MENFIPTYPDQDDENIQTIITDKLEFLENAAQIKEKDPERGELYNHQNAFKKYMLQYDNILVIDETGTGKSCEILAPIRHYKKFKSVYKKAYIIEKGASTIYDMKTQILYKCSEKDEFSSNKLINALNDKERRKIMTKEMKKWITLTTYGGFVKNALNMSDKQIENHFSDSIFVLDEAHNLKRSGETSEIYKMIWKIFHTAKRIKIILSTATPMVNSVNEITNIMNLILHENNQMPIKWDYSKVVFEQMEPFFRGRVSFVRSLDTGVEKKYMGEKIKRTYEINLPSKKWIPPLYEEGQKQPEPEMVKKEIESQLFVYPTYIKTKKDLREVNRNSEIEYLPIQNDGHKTSIKGGEKNSKSFFMSERQSASIVFPDGSYGGENSKEPNKYIYSNKQNMYKSTPEFKKYLEDPIALSTISSKISDIVKIETENTGCSYIYSEFKMWGGIFAIGQALEANGFEIFKESTSVFEYTSKKNKRMKKSFGKKKRYALLSSETTPALREILMELQNSNENVHGEYLQCFITSPAGKEGINLSHGIRGHILNASWTYAATYQALSRFLRSTSHSYLISLMREKLIEKAKNETGAKKEKTLKKAENVKIKAEIYNHISMYKDPETEEYESIDLQIYQQSEEKEIYIQYMMRFMYKCAIGSRINYDRNVRETDEDYSISCNYMKCGYKSSTANKLPSKNEIDYSTYDILYADSILNIIINEIKKKLKIDGYLDIFLFVKKWGRKDKVKNDIEYKNVQELKNDIFNSGKFREKNIYMAIEKMLNDNETLTNKFGYSCYLYMYNNILYTKSEYPTYSLKLEKPSINSNKLIYLQHTDFEKLLNLKAKPLQNLIIENLKNLDDFTITENITLFNVYLSQLSLENKINILEESIIEKSNGEDNNFDNKMIEKYQSFIAIIREPTKDIKNISEEMSNKKGKVKLEKLKINLTGESKKGEKVYIHGLNSIKEHQTKSGLITKFLNVDGMIRIYKKSEGNFRDTNQYESLAYQNILQNQRKEIFDSFSENNKYFGTIYIDNIFRLYESSNKYLGKECEGFDKPDLIKIIKEENIPAPNFEDYEINDNNRKKILNFLKKENSKDNYENFNDDELLYLYKWYLVKDGKSHMCNILRDNFDKNNKLMII